MRFYPRRFHFAAWLGGSLLALRAFATEPALATNATEPAASPDPVVTGPEPVRYEWEVMTAVLWKVGGGATPLTYRLMPQIISLRIPPINEHPLAGGRLIFRSRFSLLLEPIVRGPEDYFFGVAAAGELQWRDATDRFGCFFASGGGFGWMNAKGQRIAGAQGQDFNFNWLIHGGLSYRTREAWEWSVGLYFQHISNRNLNHVNPGLNALGPTVGLSRRF